MTNQLLPLFRLFRNAVSMPAADECSACYSIKCGQLCSFSGSCRSQFPARQTGNNKPFLTSSSACSAHDTICCIQLNISLCNKGSNRKPKTMNSIYSSLQYYTHDIWSAVDGRLTDHLPSLVGGPWLIILLTAGYIYLATTFGPKLMATRKPLNVRTHLIIYNCAMVIINGVIFVRTSIATRLGLDTWGCRPFGPHEVSNLPVVLECFNLGWYFYLS